MIVRWGFGKGLGFGRVILEIRVGIRFGVNSET